jgi:nucleotide-binding universal stress UspA family protein
MVGRKTSASGEETAMYKHILLPTDGSELSARAVREGIQFAREIGARVTVVTVTPPFYPAEMSPSSLTAHAEEHEAKSKAAAERALAPAAEAAAAARVPCTPVRRVSDSPFEEIIKVAGEAGCDLIFMASHGRRGVSALLLGSETNKVLTHSRVPVLVTR